MNLRQLSSFLAVVEDGSFTRAARQLGISQPSLSQQIRSLEAEIGGLLIERLPRGIRLTAAGNAFLPDAQAAVRASERAGDAARMALGLEAGELEIATLLSMAIGILPSAITEWHLRHPEIRIRMYEYTHPSLLEDAVREGTGDLGLGPTPIGWDGPVTALGWEELVVILPPSDPLAGRRRLPLAALADRAWVLFPPGHGLMEVASAACRHAGFQPQVAVRTTQVEAAARLVAAGVGPALVPENVVSAALPAHMARLDPPFVRELSVFTRTEWSPLSTAFLEALRGVGWRRRPRGQAIIVERGLGYSATGAPDRADRVRASSTRA
jgi:DNA-binding transcriptional LysR family regulator